MNTKPIMPMPLLARRHRSTTPTSSGKSAIGEIMLRIIGDANVAQPKNDELLEKWTGWQERAQLAIVSELMTLGRMGVANRLKPVITDPKLRIEEKY